MSIVSSGVAARLLGLSEPQLADKIRRGKLAAPPLVAGRRGWTADSIFKAALALGRVTPELLASLYRDLGESLESITARDMERRP